MIYNYNLSYEDMLRKLIYCREWGVQITDCRFRPLDVTKDDFKPHKFKEGQSDDEYYIHKEAEWTDRKIRDFRKSVREHNIWVRYAKDKGSSYDKNMEKWSSIHNTYKFFKLGRPPQFEVIEESPTWGKRLEMMNSAKNYYKKNDIPAPDFSELSDTLIDAKLKDIMASIDSINKGKTNRTP